MNLLELLEELEENASPGPWSAEFRSASIASDCRDIEELTSEFFLGGSILGPVEPGRGDFLPIDTALIVEIRNNLPALLAVAKAAMGFAENYDGGGSSFAELERTLSALEKKI